MKQGVLPNKYLGIPLFQGRSSATLWKDLIDSCVKRLDGWKGRWLSFAGKILLLQTVISAIPIYSMSCLKIPLEVLKYIEQRMQKFLWNGTLNEEKIPLIGWDSLCKPKKSGGVSLRRWRDVNKALGVKLIWEMYDNPDQLWVKIL